MRPFHRKLRREPMRVLLRHADAGVRGRSAGPDEWRGLTSVGHMQAQALVGRLGGLPIARLLSSPAQRCRQTVMPLARELAVEVEPCRLLSDGADPVELLRFLEAPETENALLCTHRETLLGVFALLAAVGPRLIEGVAPMRMAAAWTLHGPVGAPARLRHLRPMAEQVEQPAAR